MKLSKCIWILGVLVGSGAVGPVAADVIVDHQPLNTGGPAADTLFVDDFQTQTWQLAADDISLASPAVVRAIRWWGFYGSSNGGDSNMPPTGNETLRMRFYPARPSDGLPDSTNIILEQSVLNPSRVWTGRIITGGTGAHEYVFDATLATPLALAGGTRYWLEIVQVGDVSSHYRWEVSQAPSDTFAHLNPLISDWRLETVAANLAFQLSTVPEPATAGLFLGGLVAATFQQRRIRRKT